MDISMNPYSDPYGGHRPPIRQFQRLIRQNANIVGAGAVLVTAIFGMSMWLFNYFMPLLARIIPMQYAETFSYILYLLIFCVSFGVPCIAMVLMLRIPLHIAFPMRRPRGDILVSAIFIFLGAQIVGSFLIFFIKHGIDIISGGGAAPTMPSVSAPSGAVPYVAYFFISVVAPTIFEEAMFRGVMLQSLRRFGDNFAVWVTSILFALIHGNLLQSPYALLLGLVMGYFVVRSGSIWPAVIIHFINNLIVFVMEIVGAHGGQLLHEFVSVTLFITSIILGITGIIYMKSRYGALFFLKRGDYPLAEGQKHFAFFTAGFVLAATVIAVIEMRVNFV
jgi:membrane protease YdiL (CAAX protease family)